MPHAAVRRLGVPARGRGALAGRRLPASGLPAVLPLVVFYLLVCAVAQPGSPVRDEPDLIAAAARLIHGHLVPLGPAATPRAYLWHGPGLVALLAPLVGLGVPLRALRFLDPLLLGCAVLLFHHLLRGRLGERAALRWTYALGLYLPFLAVVPEVHKEPLSILLVVAGMGALAGGLRSGRAPALVGAGACLAALAMVRLEYGWVAIALLGLALVRWLGLGGGAEARRLVVVAATAVVLCVPWLAYTHHLTGRTVYWGTSSGLSLYWMSPTTEGETGQWHSPFDVAIRPELAAFRPLFAKAQTLDPVASDRALSRLAVKNIRARPLTYARNLGANLARLLAGAPMRPQHALGRILVDVVFNVPLLAAFAWAGWGLWRRRPRVPPETAPIAVFTLAAVAVHLPASASPRMLLPVVPAMLWVLAQVVAGRRGAPALPG